MRRITRNFFLHIHSARVHPYALQPTYTLGLGVILGMLFLVMIFTGALLMLHYTPSVELAYDSVKDIVHVVPGGRLVRNIHRLASDVMVLVVFLHLLRVFYTGSYLEGRRLNWIIGVVMFVVVLLMSFSGYLLPWDQLSYWAVTIGSNIAASARELTDLLGITRVLDIGGFFQRLLIGDDVVGQPALTRFFMLHVIFLPLTLLTLTGVHFWRIRKDGGLSIPAVKRTTAQTTAQATGQTTAQTTAQPHTKSTTKTSARESASEKWYSWPLVMWIELAILLGVISLLLLFAFFIDAPLLERANPDLPENPAKSPWYFLGIQELVSYSAFAGGLLVPVLFLWFLFSIPYKDREDRFTGIWFSGAAGLRTTWTSALVSAITVVVQVFILVRFGWLRDWFPGISQWFILLLNPATITSTVFIVYAERTRRRSGSSRLAAIALFTAAIVALIIFTAVGIWFRGANWEFVWGV